VHRRSALVALLLFGLALPGSAWSRPGRLRALWQQAKRRGAPRHHDALGSLSTATLVAGDTGKVGTALRASAHLAPLAGLTGAGAVGLGAASVQTLVRDRDRERRTDAAHGLAWSAQGLTTTALAFGARARWLAPASRAFGVAGGGLQVGIGAYRLGTGLHRRDRERLTLGALDVGAGGCWIASACSLATPWTLGGFALLTGARLAYTNRARIRQAGAALKRRTRRLAARVRRSRR
jgi:hypothetical protein